MSPHSRQPEPLQDPDQRGEPLVNARLLRRRLRTSTSRPFQERLVDMAAARKEIAAALRVHRAAAAAVTRRYRDQHEQQAQWPPCDAFFSDHLRDDSPPRYLAPVLPVAPPVVGGGMLRHLDRSPPALPLGLNLSFHGFTCSSVYDATNSAGDSRNRPLIQPPPADPCDSTARSSPPLAVTLSQEGSLTVDALENASSSSGAPQPVLEGEGEATCLLDWGDATATPAYAWWSNVLDRGPEDSGCVGKLGAPAGHEGGDVGVAGMPDAGWLYDGSGDQGATGSGKLVGGPETDLDGGDYYRQRDGEDIALLCMEIEGWDGEWFS